MMIVLVREFAVAGIRLVCGGRGQSLLPQVCGASFKTVTQMVAIIVAMLLLPIQNTFLGVHPKFDFRYTYLDFGCIHNNFGCGLYSKNWNLMEMK